MALRRLTVTSLALLAAALATWGALLLYAGRYWPFGTGSRDAAFLGATFGMSPQEVRRALLRAPAKLVSFEEYRRTEPANDFEFEEFLVTSSQFPEDRLKTVSTLYMPGIEMFDSKVEAQFVFRDNALTWVTVYCDPTSRNRSENVVAALRGSLASSYTFSGREASQEVPGAYRLHFSSNSARLSLWVNLSNHEKPIIILTIVNPTMEIEQQRELENRQQRAFGVKR